MEHIRTVFLRIFVAALVGLSHAACSRVPEGGEPDVPENMTTAILTVRLSLSGAGAVTSSHNDDMRLTQSRAGEDQADGSDEMLHTVRIIILDGDGYVEHNTLWDLTADPAVIASGLSFPVKRNDDKTLIFIGNEAGAVVTDMSDGSNTGVGRYFSRFYPALGNQRVHVDIDALRRNLVLDLSANNDADAVGMQLRRPLVATAVYENFHIGDDENYSGHFYLHRAAAKYTYRLTNNSTDGSVIVRAITVNNVAARQNFFFDAVFGAYNQLSVDSYVPFAGDGDEYVFPVGVDIPAGRTVEIGPFYIPEGPVVNATSAYSTGLALNDEEPVTRDITYGGDSGRQKLMTDLPRNTHVVINGSFRRSTATDLMLDVTVCPWHTYITDIPSYD